MGWKTIKTNAYLDLFTKKSYNLLINQMTYTLSKKSRFDSLSSKVRWISVWSKRLDTTERIVWSIMPIQFLANHTTIIFGQTVAGKTHFILENDPLLFYKSLPVERPNIRLPRLCWLSFSKYVEDNPGWRVWWRTITPEENIALKLKQKCAMYYIYVTYNPKSLEIIPDACELCSDSGNP